MLLKIRDFLRREGLVSNQQLARTFAMDNQALQPILDLWLKKGVIAKHEKEMACAKACHCTQGALVYYQYITPSSV